MRFKQAVILYSYQKALPRLPSNTRPPDRISIAGARNSSLADGSHRPHSHPNAHTDAELKLIKDMRRRNPHDGLVRFWIMLRQRGYSRSVSGLYKVLRRIDGKPIKLPNPKYIPKPYERMTYPGQKVQIDVKYVPASCLVEEAVEDAKENGGYYYQYTFIDEYSRFRYLEAFKEKNTYTSTVFF